MVAIPGRRKVNRLKENAGATDIILTDDELNALDYVLDSMEMSAVFSGSKIGKE